MIYVIQVGEFPNYGFIVLESEFVKLEGFNVFLPHFPINRMEGSSRYSGWLCGVILVWRINECASWIHNSRHPLSPNIKLFWMIKP